MMTDNGHDGSMQFTIFTGVSKGRTSQGIHMSKSRILSAVFSSLITKAQGNAVGQIAGIGAVSGGKNWGKIS